MLKDVLAASGGHGDTLVLEARLLPDDAPALPVDLSLHAELWVRAFNLLEPIAFLVAPALRVELADDIVHLVCTTAPTLVQHCRGQREAEQAITAAVLHGVHKREEAN
jgi:hypothetical protein